MIWLFVTFANNWEGFWLFKITVMVAIFFSTKIAAWEAMDPDERPQNFLPKKSVALYNNAFVKGFTTNHFCCFRS